MRNGSREELFPGRKSKSAGLAVCASSEKNTRMPHDSRQNPFCVSMCGRVRDLPSWRRGKSNSKGHGLSSQAAWIQILLLLLFVAGLGPQFPSMPDKYNNKILFHRAVLTIEWNNTPKSQGTLILNCLGHAQSLHYYLFQAFLQLLNHNLSLHPSLLLSSLFPPSSPFAFSSLLPSSLSCLVRGNLTQGLTHG